MKKLTFILFILLASGFSGSFKPVEKYNFLFIMADDLRPVLGSYGHKVVQSPRIDQLSAASTQFNRAYCNVPVCGASRASLLSGRRPLFPGRFITHTSRADKDAAGAVTLPQLLKQNGYYTVSNGKIFHDAGDSQEAWSEKPSRFNEVNEATPEDKLAGKANEKTGRGPFFRAEDVPDTAYADGRLAEKAIRDLQRLAGGSQPFFLSVGFVKPHLPFVAPKKYYDLYKEIPIAGNRYSPEMLPEPSRSSNEIKTYGYTEHYNTDQFHQEARHAYYACVSYIDAQIGKILDELRRLDLEKNTVVVLLGDHGWHLGEHNFWGKHNTLHNALHVPLMIKVPGKKPVKANQIVEFVDIYPTICELAGIHAPGHVHGASLVPLMDRKKIQWKNQAFAEWQGGRAVVTDRYLYTYWFEEKHNGAQMLYDHKRDPKENRNVANDPGYASVVSDHREKVVSLYRQLDLEKDN